MLVLNAAEIERLLDMPSCIHAVEAAFRVRGLGAEATSAVTGLQLPDGKLHAKLATLDASRRYAVAKINANLPGNPSQRGLPSIQGVVLLFDAATGTPLATMESASLTAIRTAAASAVAAKWLALPRASVLAIIGCGVQAHAHVAALTRVRPLHGVHVFDTNRSAAEALCSEIARTYDLQCEVARDASDAIAAAQIVVTLTPSRQPILDAGDVALGTFIAAVGADSEGKQELGVQLLRAAAIVVDDIEQCATIGDLHHAIVAGALTKSDVRASLDQIVSERVRGRLDDKEIIVFDSTGVAVEDAAAAALAYEKAEQSAMGIRVWAADQLAAHRPIQ